MHFSVSVGDIFRFKVDYQDEPQGAKERPVVVLAVSEDKVIAVAAQITTKAPKEPPSYHDQFKFPIWNWRKSGLERSSWVKTSPENMLEIEVHHLKDYVGHLHQEDLSRLLDQLEIELSRHDKVL